ANTLIMHRVESVRDEQLPLALWLGIATGVAWSWLRYAILFAVIAFLGELFWKKLSYVPHLGMFDQGLTLAIILLPVAGLGVTLQLFLSDGEDYRAAAKSSGRVFKKEIL